MWKNLILSKQLFQLLKFIVKISYFTYSFIYHLKKVKN